MTSDTQFLHDAIDTTTFQTMRFTLRESLDRENDSMNHNIIEAC